MCHYMCDGLVKKQYGVTRVYNVHGQHGMIAEILLPCVASLTLFLVVVVS